MNGSSLTVAFSMNWQKIMSLQMQVRNYKSRGVNKIINKTNKAASCDYVEQNRRNTAINFVLDAFNGRVDSILSKVKHNNFGKLSQEIKDAFQLVNYNGSAFRSAK